MKFVTPLWNRVCLALGIFLIITAYYIFAVWLKEIALCGGISIPGELNTIPAPIHSNIIQTTALMVIGNITGNQYLVPCSEGANFSILSLIITLIIFGIFSYFLSCIIIILYSKLTKKKKVSPKKSVMR